MWNHYFATHQLRESHGEDIHMLCQLCKNRELVFKFPNDVGEFERNVRMYGLGGQNIFFHRALRTT